MEAFSVIVLFVRCFVVSSSNRDACLLYIPCSFCVEVMIPVSCYLAFAHRHAGTASHAVMNDPQVAPEGL